MPAMLSWQSGIYITYTLSPSLCCLFILSIAKSTPCFVSCLRSSFSSLSFNARANAFASSFSYNNSKAYFAVSRRPLAFKQGPKIKPIWYACNVLFSNSFAKIRYLDNLQWVETNVTYVTPSLLENKIVLETTKNVSTSEEVELIFTIRNKEYAIRIK